MKKKLLWSLPFLLLLTSCIERSHISVKEERTTSVSNEVYHPVYVSAQRASLQTAWSLLSKGDEWTAFSQEAIRKYGQALLRTEPKDILEYCPKYSQLDVVGRGDFWVNLISKLAYFESSYNPNSSYTERFTDNNGNRVVSRGLLQISKESANGSYYRCEIQDPQSLHDPKTNLECGVRIMNKWIGTDQVISGKEGVKWRGLARYWSPFRNTEKREKIANYTSSLSYCQ